MGSNQSKPTPPAGSIHATYPDPQEGVTLKPASLAGENHKTNYSSPMGREHKLTPPAQWGLSMQPILPPVGRTLKKGDKQETTSLFF